MFSVLLASVAGVAVGFSVFPEAINVVLQCLGQ